MSPSLSILIALVLVLSIVNGNKISYENVTYPSCPMNFNALRKLKIKSGGGRKFVDVPRQCEYVLEGMRLVRSEYLWTNGHFLPPPVTTLECWVSYQSLILELVPLFDIKSSCGYDPKWLSQGCMNVNSQSEFEKLIPESKLQEIKLYCNQSLESTSACASCTNILSSLNAYLHGPENGNASDCTGYPFIYAAAIINPFGPTNTETAKCLFSLHFPLSPRNNQHIYAISGAIAGSAMGVFGAIIAVSLYCRSGKKWAKEKKTVSKTETSDFSELISITRSTSLVKYRFEEIKIATMDFSREKIIGKGGYGNVYNGKLQDGSEVAVKRFKNCSIAGAKTFAHEVEVIASVQHVNLVKLRGYCTTNVPFQGHHRVIVCELVHNGSLYDHLFGSNEEKLSWPIRQKIALGTARGLAYLHYEAQPCIIHRDIKATNILLDENFEPKVADFGLAKFNLEGATHLSTRVAGTLGYVAPEYALFGKLTKGGDVYSFGVVLLELLSGKKAVLSMSEGRTLLLADWAWSLVSEGRVLDVIEENMPEIGLAKVMEHYIFVAVLCCHPHLHARPTMDQVVKMLETNMRVPMISTDAKQ